MTNREQLENEFEEAEAYVAKLRWQLANTDESDVEEIAAIEKSLRRAKFDRNEILDDLYILENKIG